jgi:hypothetical protein
MISSRHPLPSSTLWTFTVGSASHNTCALLKKSGGSGGVTSPRKSLICESRIRTAMPLVKPVITDTGTKRIHEPMRATPMANSMSPAIIVQMSRFATPYRATIAYTITMKAPVGPPICTREPPRALTRKPATIAV